MRRGDAGGDLLLGDDRNVRRGRAQAGDDQRLGGVVGLGDRAAVGLRLRHEAAGAHLHDGRPGAGGEVEGKIEQRCVIHASAHTGASGMAQSRNCEAGLAARRAP